MLNVHFKQKQRAEQRLNESKQAAVDFKRAELALRRAVNRIKVSKGDLIIHASFIMKGVFLFLKRIVLYELKNLTNVSTSLKNIILK